MGRIYLKEFGLAMVAYAATLFLSIWLIDTAPAAPWRFAVALLPMIPAIGVMVTVLRQLRRMDELQRQIQFEALAFAFAGTALLTFGYGFVENVGLPHLNWFFVWPIMAILWAIGSRHRRAAVWRMKNHLRELRAAQGWSQADLGTRLGVSRQTINALESGKYDPSLPLAFAIAHLFGRPIEAIFTPEHPEPAGKES